MNSNMTYTDTTPYQTHHTLFIIKDMMEMKENKKATL